MGRAGSSPSSFHFVATLHSQQPPVNERRGYHFVLGSPPTAQQFVPSAAPVAPKAHPTTPSSTLIFGCGINGELTIARLVVGERNKSGASAVPATLSMLNTSVGADLLQSRAMLWDDDGRLIVSNRDFLIYDVVAHAEQGRSLRLHANISTPLSNLPGSLSSGMGANDVAQPAARPAGTLQRRGQRGSRDNGINGMITATDGCGTVLLVGAAMPGLLAAAVLKTRDSTARAHSFGSVESARFGLGGIYDIDRIPSDPVSSSVSSAAPVQPQQPPLAVVVSPYRTTGQKAILGILRMHGLEDRAFAPPLNWTLVGSLAFADVERTAARGGLNASRAKGCNRVRVHHRSHRAAFSCFGSHAEGGDIIGFVNVSDPEHPRLLTVVPFLTQQPTGMLVVGDALFVAGELDIMVFDMRAPVASPPLLATCGDACARVATERGQNFHSLAYRAVEGRHLIFISAQIDNNIGCVQIVDNRVIALLSD